PIDEHDADREQADQQAVQRPQRQRPEVHVPPPSTCGSSRRSAARGPASSLGSAGRATFPTKIRRVFALNGSTGQSRLPAAKSTPLGASWPEVTSLRTTESTLFNRRRGLDALPPGA